MFLKMAAKLDFLTNVATTSHLNENNNYFKNAIMSSSNDVLNGRSKSICTWYGNVLCRNLTQYYKLECIVLMPEE